MTGAEGLDLVAGRRIGEFGVADHGEVKRRPTALADLRHRLDQVDEALGANEAAHEEEAHRVVWVVLRLERAALRRRRCHRGRQGQHGEALGGDADGEEIVAVELAVAGHVLGAGQVVPLNGRALHRPAAVGVAHQCQRGHVVVGPEHRAAGRDGEDRVEQVVGDAELVPVQVHPPEFGSGKDLEGPPSRDERVVAVVGEHDRRHRYAGARQGVDDLELVAQAVGDGVVADEDPVVQRDSARVHVAAVSLPGTGLALPARTHRPRPRAGVPVVRPAPRPGAPAGRRAARRG